MTTPNRPPIRLMVVDDSAYNRRNIADVFAGNPEVEVVGKAADGEEALRLASLLKPDVITLDLEMPRMDGFTFLRILMMKQPTPVIVVSSYSQKENVFKALELGALDFVTKPDRQISPDATELREQILQKVLLVRSLRPTFTPPITRRNVSGAWTADGKPQPMDGTGTAAGAYVAPKHVVCIASSTGGPSALLEIFGKLPATTAGAFLVAQHMPDKFTRTFAERLDKRGPVRTSEAQDADQVARMTGFVCPGRQCMELVNMGQELRLRVAPAAPNDRYVPSADRLLRTAAAAAGSKCIGVILTGMGDDGVEGARAILDAGGMIVAESQETAVVYGMPGAVVRAGLAAKVMPLPQIAEFLAQLPS
ncbi:MAG TPA: chemotaxis-specific protein-glutamate methyltransferase CheB [Polyangiaceae bacterium]